MEKKKKCTQCKKDKVLKEFHKHLDAHDGRGTICKQCVNEKAAIEREAEKKYSVNYFTHSNNSFI